MKIQLYAQARSTLSAFAEEHDLVLEIHERSPRDMGARWTADSRYYAEFADAEVKDGCCLVGTFGNGETPTAAMQNYAEAISGALLVIGAYSTNRRELRVPLLGSDL